MKHEIRKKMIADRGYHHTQHGHVHCLQIMHRFLSLPEYLSAKCLLLYSAKGSEVHTEGIIQSALLAGKKVVLPATMKESHSLELYEIKSASGLVLGAFGIMEPPKNAASRVQPEEIDIVVVPGVSFDRHGHRLGYGSGYYDSFLGKVKGKKIALAYGMQVLDKVPHEAHDISMDMVVTEGETIVCGQASAAPIGSGEASLPAPAAGPAPITPAPIVILASGRGSDFQSIIDGINEGKVAAKIVALITDNPNAAAIEKAKANSIPAFIIEASTPEERDPRIKQKLDELSPSLVVLAGYMRIIRSKELLSAYHGRMINIHPSLLPKYPGAHAQKDAFEAGEKISGYTIHYVDESLDGGPIIHQEQVDISGCKSADEAAAKILEREHAGLPMIVDRLVREKKLL
ncbi:Phosphoribosylglycinamide formyltransferase [uncultured archaeon]|nr:Phosphoribosylglycinamide formyltransferase [uncultured archaeon]